MRKLLVCLLAAAMLLAFTGVANAVADSEVLVFTAPISFPVHIVKESQAAVISTTTGIAKTTLVTKTHTFTGHLVANVSVVLRIWDEPERNYNQRGVFLWYS